MNKARKVTASLMIVLLVSVIWSSAGMSHDRNTRVIFQPAHQEPSAQSPAQAKPRQMGREEKLVRDVYARLMRYQSAARDEFAARESKSSQPQDYLIIELRDIRSGAIEKISDRPLSELVTDRNGAAISITPNHLRNGDEPAHAYYEAQWAQASASEKAAASTVGEMLSKVNQGRGVNRYTSYEVTIRFQGQSRSYRAIAVYQFENPNEGLQSGSQESAPLTEVQIWDNITPEMNTVLKDQSPPVHAPWNRYVQSSRYKAVVNEIKETQVSGKELIPAGAPIGYLPGDNAESRSAFPNDPCPVTTVTLTATGVQESGKPTHFISLKNTGNVTVTATLDPANSDPASITWTGGTAGSDNLHRIVSSTTVADTDVTAAIGTTSSATVRIHVIDATAAPAAGADAPKTWSLGGTANTNGSFGLTAVQIGEQGVARPVYHVDAYFDGDHWVFRLRDVAHQYKVGTNSLGDIDLPNGNPAVFPLAPGMNLTQSHTEARDDFDTSGLSGSGPRRRSYWVLNITQAHEQAHVDYFYSTAYWQHYMGLFETDDVEASTVTVVYNCTDNTTTTGTAAMAQKQAGWDTAIDSRHGAAFSAHFSTAETHAHGVSNPMYAPIRSAIPNP